MTKQEIRKVVTSLQNFIKQGGRVLYFPNEDTCCVSCDKEQQRNSCSACKWKGYCWIKNKTALGAEWKRLKEVKRILQKLGMLSIRD